MVGGGHGGVNEDEEYFDLLPYIEQRHLTSY
jgi:hypothetical protein